MWSSSCFPPPPVSRRGGNNACTQRAPPHARTVWYGFGRGKLMIHLLILTRKDKCPRAEPLCQKAMPRPAWIKSARRLLSPSAGRSAPYLCVRSLLLLSPTAPPSPPPPAFVLVSFFFSRYGAAYVHKDRSCILDRRRQQQQPWPCVGEVSACVGARLGALGTRQARLSAARRRIWDVSGCSDWLARRAATLLRVLLLPLSQGFIYLYACLYIYLPRQALQRPQPATLRNYKCLFGPKQERVKCSHSSSCSFSYSVSSLDKKHVKHFFVITLGYLCCGHKKLKPTDFYSFKDQMTTLLWSVIEYKMHKHLLPRVLALKGA